MTPAIRRLLTQKKITRVDLNEAIAGQVQSGKTVDAHLVQNGAISADEFVRFLIQEFSFKHWPTDKLTKISSDVISRIRKEMALRFRLIPIKWQKDQLIIGMTDPSSAHTIGEVSRKVGCDIVPVVVSNANMDDLLDTFYSQPAEPADDVTNLETDDSQEPLPLTTRIPPAANGTLFEQAPDEADSKSTAANSIEDAFNAIPLVQLKSSMPPVSYQTKSQPTARREITQRFKLETVKAESDTQKLRRQKIRNMVDNDSWSQPFPPYAQQANQLAAAKDHSRTPAAGEMLAAMVKLNDRDAIIALALEYMLKFSQRAIFFVVKKGVIRGFNIAGQFTNKDAIRTFWIPSSAVSTLSDVCNEKRFYWGKLGTSAADKILCASLGETPKKVLILPVIIHERIVGLIFADRMTIGTPPWPNLERLTEAVSDNLLRIIRKKG